MNYSVYSFVAISRLAQGPSPPKQSPEIVPSAESPRQVTAKLVGSARILGAGATPNGFRRFLQWVLFGHAPAELRDGLEFEVLLNRESELADFQSRFVQAKNVVIEVSFLGGSPTDSRPAKD